MKRLQMILAENLKHLRISRGYSQEKLAEIVDLHRTYISGIERGTRNVSLQNIEKIALALHVSPADLLTEQEDPGSTFN